MLRWLSRCLPGLNIILFCLLLLFAFTDVDEWTPYLSCMRQARAAFFKTEPNELPRSAPVRLKISQRIFIVYTILVHLDTLVFSTRLAVALVRVNGKIKKVFRGRKQSSVPNVAAKINGSPRLLAYEDEHHANGIMVVDHPTDVESYGEVTHSIILPNYAEDLETLTATLRVLASHPRASQRYEVYLAMEQKEQGCESKAACLMSTFESKFASIKATYHPVGLPGEVAGKGSNVSWAARDIFQTHGTNKARSDVVITIIDSDTHLAQDYFNEIRRMHHTNPKASHALYVCPIVFDRNAHDVPVFVRVADILWGCAGLAGFLPGGPILIPTSVYSISVTLAEEVGGWDGDATAIGEDMHMLIKTYFNSNGRLTTLPVYSPASQCNVSSGERRGLRRTVDNLFARWRQALRHMWGCLDVGFAMRRMVKLKQLRLAHLPLFHLLFEAHVLPVHFVLLILSSSVYTFFKPAELIHPDLRWTFAFTNLLRTISFLCMQLDLTLYAMYHGTCVTQRAADMARAGITETFAYRQSWRLKYIIDRIVFPIAGIMYGALPAVYAQMAHFWTDKLTYGVSVKPLLNALG